MKDIIKLKEWIEISSGADPAGTDDQSAVESTETPETMVH